MKSDTLASLAFAIALSVLGGCATRASDVELYGSAAVPADYQPTIVITPTTRYVNVEGGQTVRFLVNGKAFAWTFNISLPINSFDLNEVAPPGLLDHPVRAFVSPDPKYIGSIVDAGRCPDFAGARPWQANACPPPEDSSNKKPILQKYRMG